MDVPKLLSILIDQALYFPSALQLSKEDRYEGQPTDEMVRLFRERKVDIDIVGEFTGQTPSYKDIHASIIDQVNAAYANWQYQTGSFFISCWHMNEGESDAMWKVYSSDNGIAIKS